MEETIPEPEVPVLEESKLPKRQLKKGAQWTIVSLLWLVPSLLLLTAYVLFMPEEGTLPGFEELENPRTNLASRVYSAD